MHPAAGRAQLGRRGMIHPPTHPPTPLPCLSRQTLMGKARQKATTRLLLQAHDRGPFLHEQVLARGLLVGVIDLCLLSERGGGLFEFASPRVEVRQDGLVPARCVRRPRHRPQNQRDRWWPLAVKCRPPNRRSMHGRDPEGPCAREATVPGVRTDCSPRPSAPTYRALRWRSVIDIDTLSANSGRAFEKRPGCAFSFPKSGSCALVDAMRLRSVAVGR